MAKFDPYKFLEQGLARFEPEGGYGIPNIGALRELLRGESASGFRQALGQEGRAFERAGMGRSVARAFSPGTRKMQFSNSLMEQLARLQAQHGQMAASQRGQTLGTLAGNPLQMAYQEANKPSLLSSLLGGALGLGAQAFLPGLAGMIFPNRELEQLMQALGGGTEYN